MPTAILHDHAGTSYAAGGRWCRRRVGGLVHGWLGILAPMDPITRRNRSRTTGANIYWRRRLFALAAGLAVFGVLAWAVGGANTHPVAATSSVSTKPPHTYPPPSTLPVTPSPSPSSSSPSPSPSASSSSPSPSPSPSPSKSKQPAKASHPKTGRSALGDDCPSADVVVSLSSNGDSYAPGARPKFTMSVVSTAGRRCAFNLGPRYLRLVIHSGSVRVWGSADCLHGSGTQVAMLRRGVPVQRKLTWDRTLSTAGCRLSHTAARPGAYTATASDSGVQSRTLVFDLR
jgi:hypothetical protein